MGKRLIPQRRGRGGAVYRSPSHRHLGRLSLPTIGGKVVRLMHAPGRNSPAALLDSGELIIAPFNLSTNSMIRVCDVNQADELEPGNVHALRHLNEGQEIHNVELHPNDGGKLARANGTFCRIIRSSGDATIVRTLAGVLKTLSGNCRAAIGRVAGSGVNEVKIGKAGTKRHYYRSRSKRSFKVSGVSMNPVNHPHGGGNHPHVGTRSSVSRHTSPGRKVGNLGKQKRVRTKVNIS